jgi:hypothetical protein
MKNFLEKFNDGEEANFRELNQLDEFVFESKSRLSIKYEDVSKIKEENLINNTKNNNINNRKLFELKIKKNHTRMEKKNYKIVKKSVSINDSYNNKKNNLSNRDKIKRRNTENNNISYISSDIKLKSFGNNKKKFISPFKLNYDNKINKTENKETFYNPIDIKKRLQQKNIKIFKLNNNENNKNKIKIFKISNNIKFSILKEKKNKNMNLQIVKSVSNYECINFNYNNKKDIIIKHINDIDLNNIHKKSDLILLEKKLQILTNKIRTKLNLPVDKEGEEKLLDTFGALLIDRINKAKNNYK